MEHLAAQGPARDFSPILAPRCVDIRGVNILMSFCQSNGAEIPVMPRLIHIDALVWVLLDVSPQQLEVTLLLLSKSKHRPQGC